MRNAFLLSTCLALALSACRTPTPQPVASNPAPAGGAPNAPGAPAPAAGTVPANAAQPAAPAPATQFVPHSQDDTPILIADGSMWVALNPLGGQGSSGKPLTFNNFDLQPGDRRHEVRSLVLMSLDGLRFAWDGLEINGAAASTCQKADEDCLIQVQYEGPGMDLEVSWAVDPNNPRRQLTLRFPGRPVNEWVDWVRDSHIVFHPVDWDHSARRRFSQVFVNRAPQTLDPNGTRITIHLKPEPR